MSMPQSGNTGNRQSRYSVVCKGIIILAHLFVVVCIFLCIFGWLLGYTLFCWLAGLFHLHVVVVVVCLFVCIFHWLLGYSLFCWLVCLFNNQLQPLNAESNAMQQWGLSFHQGLHTLVYDILSV